MHILYVSFYAVIRAATVTSPSQTSAIMTEVTPSPCPSPTHTLQSMDMGMLHSDH